MKNLALIRSDESTFCKLSLDNGSSWIQGIIVNFSEHNGTIRIFLSSKNFYRYYNSKNKVIVKALDNKNEYIYVGVIDNTLLNHKSHFIKVNVEQTLSFDDNRKSTRFLVNYIATITNEDNTTFSTKVFDLSLNGLSFTTDNKLKPNSKILISIKIDSANSINLSGVIVNQIAVNSSYRYSVQTTPYRQEDQDNLSSLIEDLILRQNGIYNKYSFLGTIKKIFVILLYLICLGLIGYLLYLLYVS